MLTPMDVIHAQLGSTVIQEIAIVKSAIQLLDTLVGRKERGILANTVALVSMPTLPFTSARFARSESTVSVVSTNVHSANLAHLIARKEAVAAPLVCQVLFLPRELASLARLVRAHPSEVRVA